MEEQRRRSPKFGRRRLVGWLISLRVVIQVLPFTGRSHARISLSAAYRFNSTRNPSISRA